VTNPDPVPPPALMGRRHLTARGTPKKRKPQAPPAPWAPLPDLSPGVEPGVNTKVGLQYQ
jgi:hypothetical protein